MVLLERLFYRTLLACMIIIPFAGCNNTPENAKETEQKQISTVVESAIEDSVKELPEVDLLEKQIRFIPQTDTAAAEKLICEIFIVKKDLNPHNFTDYTDKLIKLRVTSKVKEKLTAEKLNAEPYFNIVFLTKS